MIFNIIIDWLRKRFFVNPFLVVGCVASIGGRRRRIATRRDDCKEEDFFSVQGIRIRDDIFTEIIISVSDGGKFNCSVVVSDRYQSRQSDFNCCMLPNEGCSFSALLFFGPRVNQVLCIGVDGVTTHGAFFFSRLIMPPAFHTCSK